MCILMRDWWCFASILAGMYAGIGICISLRCTGSLKVVSPGCAPGSKERQRNGPQELQDRLPQSSENKNSTYGDGGLLLHEHGAIVLRGDENTLGELTRGHFHIDFSEPAEELNSILVLPFHWQRELCISLIRRFAYRRHIDLELDEYLRGFIDSFFKHATIHMGLSAMMIQFLMQIILIPQGTLFGQLMFATSLGLSSIYNVYLATRQDSFQTRFLLDLYGLKESSFKRTLLTSKAGMAVFACLALRHLPLYAPRKILNTLVEGEGVVWGRWKELVVRKLESGEPVEFSEEERRWEGLDEAGKSELSERLDEAVAGYTGILIHQRTLVTANP